MKNADRRSGECLKQVRDNQIREKSNFLPKNQLLDLVNGIFLRNPVNDIRRDISGPVISVIFNTQHSVTSRCHERELKRERAQERAQKKELKRALKRAKI